MSEPGNIGANKQAWAQNFMGANMTNFRFAPQEPFGRADWDLIFKGFLDVGSTDIAFAQPGEDSYTLVGTGVGVEFQFKRYLTARLDWGFALEDVRDGGTDVTAGDSRVHVSLTFLY